MSGSEVSPETADLQQSNNAKSRSSTRQQRTQSRRIRTYSTYTTTPSPSRARGRLAPIGANESSSSSRFYGQSAAISITNHSTESNSVTPSRQNSISQNPKRLAGISAGTAATTDFSIALLQIVHQPVSSSENEHDDGNVFNDFEPRIVEASQADSSVLRALQEITGLVNTVVKRIDRIEEKLSQQQEVKGKENSKPKKAIPLVINVSYTVR